MIVSKYMKKAAAKMFCRPPHSGLTQRRVRTVPLLLALLFCFGFRAEAQVARAATGGEQSVFVGGAFSVGHNNYGSRTLFGVDLSVYANVSKSLGVEGEASWLTFRQRAGVHDATYLIGPRYSFPSFGNFTASAKVLAGNGQFYFPYDYAKGSYFVVAPGGDLMYWLNRRVRINVVDVEYQDWPQFSYGSFSALKVSAGIQFHLF